MSYIPDVRTDKDYNESKLNERYQRVLVGYDFATEDIVDNFVDGIDVYADEFEIEGEDINLTRLLENHPAIADKLKECLADWMEMHRNELVVSMLDNQYAEEEDEE